MHREEGGLQNVDLINLLGGNNPDTPRQSSFLDDRAERVALMLGELLGVEEQGMVEGRGQDHSRSDDRAG